jgi:hypothetical protein
VKIFNYRQVFEQPRATSAEHSLHLSGLSIARWCAPVSRSKNFYPLQKRGKLIFFRWRNSVLKELVPLGGIFCSARRPLFSFVTESFVYVASKQKALALESR